MSPRSPPKVFQPLVESPQAHPRTGAGDRTYGSVESAEILSKDCFAACEGLAAFLSFDLLLKSYNKNSVAKGLKLGGAYGSLCICC